jgi:SSS family transporter
MHGISTVDYVVIVVYLVLMVGIGLYFMRFMKGARDYFAGGNKIPWWVAGISLYMSNFSAWTFSGAAGFAYYTGWFALIYFGTWWIGWTVGSQITAARWRRSRVISPVEYTHTRYNIPTQQFLGWVIALNFTLAAGVQLAALSKIMSATLRLPMEWMIIGSGVVMIAYTFMGGLWAVSITDVVQFVILLGIVLLIVPLGLKEIGGFGELVRNLPPLQLEHVYNGVRYDLHWVVALVLITTVGVAAGGAQRFYSVRDERSARKVGLMCGAAFLTVPLLFGIPPLVARVLWPDLSAVPFFQQAEQPNDLVFIGVALKVLPVGLIGIFLSAMFAATMSAMDSTYNMVSSIISRDLYKDGFRPEASDRQVLRVGKIATLSIGVLTVVLALVFVNHSLGIFGLMMAFFTLFNMPVNIPMAFGLIFKRVPRWGAFATIAWGLLVGAATRYLLGWSIGPQVYLVTVVCFAIFVASDWLGRLYNESKGKLIAASVFWTLLLAILFFRYPQTELTPWLRFWVAATVLAMGASVYWFARLFGSESEEDRRLVGSFFQRLETPVDVVKEVYGAGEKEVSTFPLVGTITMIIGALVLLLVLGPAPKTDTPIFLILSGVLLLFGFLMFYFGKKSEERFLQELRRLGVAEVPEAAAANTDR